jgi:hypothetical protein
LIEAPTPHPPSLGFASARAPFPARGEGKRGREEERKRGREEERKRGREEERKRGRGEESLLRRCAKHWSE